MASKFGNFIKKVGRVAGGALRIVGGLPGGGAGQALQIASRVPIALQRKGSIPQSRAQISTSEAIAQNESMWSKIINSKPVQWVKDNWIWIVIPVGGAILLFIVYKLFFKKGRRRSTRRATHRRGTSATRLRMARVRAARRPKLRSRGRRKARK